MSKCPVFMFVAAAACASVISCASAPEQKVVAPQKVAVKQEAPSFNIVDIQNEQLAKIPVEGFALGGASVPAQKWDAWAKAAAPVVKGVIEKLPEGYLLQITGHTDASGSEEQTSRYIGNKNLSVKRAAAVYESFKKQGISSSKITYKGVGSSEKLEGAAADADVQRRITFKVVKAN